MEAQKKQQEAKLRQLPRYAMGLWLRHECPVDVLVICPDRETAEFYAAPISFPVPVPGRVFLPRALFPELVPAFTAPVEVARNPAMAVLSLAYHGRDPAVAGAFIDGVSLLGEERGGKYYEYGYSMSPRAVCEVLEAMVASTKWPVYSPFAKEHFGKGKAEGLAEGLAEGKLEGARETVRMVLKARGLQPSSDQQARVDACTDLAQLGKWADAALTASTASDVFDS